MSVVVVVLQFLDSKEILIEISAVVARYARIYRAFNGKKLSPSALPTASTKFLSLLAYRVLPSAILAAFVSRTLPVVASLLESSSAITTGGFHLRVKARFGFQYPQLYVYRLHVLVFLLSHVSSRFYSL